jgi:hypothetical protein
VVALGQLAPSAVQCWVRSLGRGLAAVGAAWLVALAIGSTALQGQISLALARLGNQLESWAQASDGIPVLAPVARMVSGAYDASFGALSSWESALGLGLIIFLLGAVVGGVGLWAASRRRAAVRGRSTHRA